MNKENLIVIDSIGQAITASIDLDKIIETIYENINRIIDAPIFGIALYNEMNRMVNFELLVEDGTRKPPFTVSVDNEASLAVRCVLNREEFIISEVHPETELVLNEPETENKRPQSIIYIPLIIEEKVIGALTIQSYSKNAYTKDHFTSLKALSSYITIALNNSQKSRELMELEREKVLAVSRLVAGIAHEMNTPLGVSVSAASYIKELNDMGLAKLSNGTMTKEALKDYVTGITESIEILNHNLLRTTEMVEKFKQIGATNREKEKMTFDLKEMLYAITTGFEKAGKGISQEIQIFCPPELEIDSYPDAYYQIFSNLILNSLKHGFPETEARGEGEWIRIQLLLSDCSLKIIYEDNGIGIPEENLPRIFEPFFTTNRIRGGKGLGLNIIHNLVVNTLEGTIECKSESGKGATFTIEVPIEWPCSRIKIRIP